MTALVDMGKRAAKEAGLRYVSDQQPGISRQAEDGAFAYRHPHGQRVRDADTLDRIRRLVIPPAWTDVWICPVPTGHIQATGRDARGRKQYRYHQDWRDTRDTTRYGRMLDFGKALPAIRQRVATDLRRHGMRRERVLATVVRLLESTLIRVGNDEYAQQNGSYGLTTMRNRHTRVNGSTITFTFKGKSGKQHQIGVRDPQLAKLVRRCQDLPGQELFGYVDEEGNVHDVTSQDVNGYLREIAGADFSAKDYRTWAGTVLAAQALVEFAPAHSGRERKSNIVQVIKAVAKMLGNTPAVCRRSYIHPAIFECYMAGQIIRVPKRSLDQGRTGGLTKLQPPEAAVMRLLSKAAASTNMSS